MKVNNRWFQMIALVIAMVMIANLQYGWTLFVKSLQGAHGWSLSEVQWAFTLFILFQTWVQPLDGWLVDRLGPRIFFSVAGVLSGLGWSALAFVTTLTQMYVAYAIAGIGSALVYSGSIGSARRRSDPSHQTLRRSTRLAHCRRICRSSPMSLTRCSPRTAPRDRRSTSCGKAR